MSGDPAEVVGRSLARIETLLGEIEKEQRVIAAALEGEVGCLHRTRTETTTMGAAGRTILCLDCGETVSFGADDG